LPSTYYTVQFTVNPSSGSPDGVAANGASASGIGSPIQVTKKFGTDSPSAWNYYPGQWIVTYQPLFDPNSINGLNFIQSLGYIMDDITTTPPWDANSI